ncbi:glycosyl transferase, WecB/TagA/CpsF family [Thalassoporum mexicanum PCC 7367]|uniref:WecB/TagA/CpsF family glycosyltransferase n=1 Tax=Thalassoporum mexicanum TaxID=3457544 RepID=UPI00029FBC44|nr:WecB/TagA/CpsF family glycosyltransferase [Pseudanabaena sp. PCC 7367]AFY69723.1 glycosyl transferase, WecB/TagA/CpsF family [Pseudanabaena sp. PCC 7367]
MPYILGSRIDATSYAQVCDRLVACLAAGQYGYVVAANVHVVMTAFWQRQYQRIVNNAMIVTPDGMPLVWGLRLLGIKKQSRVYGPDLMLAWCDRAAQANLPIYLYGATTETLTKLEQNLRLQFPGLTIAGSYAPPYRSAISLAEVTADVARINATKPAVVFVGLGCPKQEYWMVAAEMKLEAIAIGVGAAFDFHAGTVSQSPRWMMNLGLEWCYRFMQEPGRLWRRYLINNPMFVVLFGWQLLRRKLGFAKQGNRQTDR